MSCSGTTTVSLYVIAAKHQTGPASADTLVEGVFFPLFFFGPFFGRGSSSARSHRACRLIPQHGVVLGPSRVLTFWGRKFRVSSLGIIGEPPLSPPLLNAFIKSWPHRLINLRLEVMTGSYDTCDSRSRLGPCGIATAGESAQLGADFRYPKSLFIKMKKRAGPVPGDQLKKKKNNKKTSLPLTALVAGYGNPPKTRETKVTRCDPVRQTPYFISTTYSTQ